MINRQLPARLPGYLLHYSQESTAQWIEMKNDLPAMLSTDGGTDIAVGSAQQSRSQSRLCAGLEPAVKRCVSAKK